MKHLPITILLVLTLIQHVNSQDKVIRGDTAFWNSRNQEHINKLELTDLNKSKSDFAFRFWNQGQVIEIFNEDNQIHGELTNYIYHSNKGNKNDKDTLIQKIQLDTKKSTEAYKIIQESGILALQSDNEIDGWTQGCDGINYIIEHSDKNEYWYKNYWTPSAQDSIPESIIVIDFVKALSDTLHLSERYKEFTEGLPHRGCYNSGGMINTCYISNSYGFGYYGSFRLPLGFSSSLNLTYIGKMQTNFGLGFQYKSDRNHNYDLGFDALKSNLFFRNSRISDFLIYNYQKRKLDFQNSNEVINNRFRYGISINNRFSIGTGLDYMIDNKEKIGGTFSISKWFYKPQISTTVISSIFEDEMDYKIGISKSIHFNNMFIIRSTSVGLYFENFKDYNDLNLNLMFWL